MPKDKFSQILTPKGTSIANDDSNVGVQLLKKMGWTQSTGLGKDGSGILEPIRASSNFGRKGLGKGPMQSAVNMVQQAHFDIILQSLNQNSKSGESGEDTEEEMKPDLSKAQMRYGKFTRAKDVSNYDQQKLKVILGRAVVESKEISPSKDTESSSVKIESDFGVKTYPSSTDLKTYFDSKMQGAKSYSPLTSVPRKRKRCDSLNYVVSKLSADGHSEYDLTDPSYIMISNEPVSETSKDDLNDLPSSKESAAEIVDAFESKELPGSSVGKMDAPDDSGSGSGISAEEIENESPSGDALECFVNSNILTIKGYLYY